MQKRGSALPLGNILIPRASSVLYFSFVEFIQRKLSLNSSVPLCVLSSSIYLSFVILLSTSVRFLHSLPYFSLPFIPWYLCLQAYQVPSEQFCFRQITSPLKIILSQPTLLCGCNSSNFWIFYEACNVQLSVVWLTIIPWLIYKCNKFNSSVSGLDMTISLHVQCIFISSLHPCIIISNWWIFNQANLLPDLNIFLILHCSSALFPNKLGSCVYPRDKQECVAESAFNPSPDSPCRCLLCHPLVTGQKWLLAEPFYSLVLFFFSGFNSRLPRSQSSRDRIPVRKKRWHCFSGSAFVEIRGIFTFPKCLRNWRGLS